MIILVHHKSNRQKLVLSRIHRQKTTLFIFSYTYNNKSKSVFRGDFEIYNKLLYKSINPEQKIIWSFPFLNSFLRSEPKVRFLDHFRLNLRPFVCLISFLTWTKDEWKFCDFEARSRPYVLVFVKNNFGFVYRRQKEF